MTDSTSVALPGGDATPLSAHDHGNCELCDAIEAHLTLARQQVTDLENEQIEMFGTMQTALGFDEIGDDPSDLWFHAKRIVDELLKLRAQVKALQQERDAIAEELASNRACNLYTWKETAVRAIARAEAAEQQITALRETMKEPT